MRYCGEQIVMMKQMIGVIPTQGVLPHSLIKSFCSEISSAFSFYDRELDMVSKCRQMNKLYCKIIKISGNYEKKKEILRVWITNTWKSLHQVLHLLL